jgi:hypothetical protein
MYFVEIVAKLAGNATIIVFKELQYAAPTELAI